MAAPDYLYDENDPYKLNQPDRSITDPPLPGRSTDTTKVPMQSFGDVGHDGNYNGLTREQWRDKWMGAGQMSTAQMDQWMAANGATKLAGNGTYRTPFGETLDLGIGARSGSVTPGWTDTGGNSSSAGGGSGNGGSGSGGGSSSGGDQWDQLYQTLMDRSNQSLDVKRTDPAVRGQADAFTANQERQRRQLLASNAESANPYGSGAQNNLARMTADKAGQNSGSFEAELMGRELTSRRDEITQALSQMGSMLSQQQQLALQRELGQLNAEIQRQQLAQNQSQFDSTLGFNVEDRQSYWDAIRSGAING